MSGTTWVVMRTAPEVEPVAQLDDGEEAQRLAGELGPPHVAVPVPHVVVGAWRVVPTWACRARVAGGQMVVGEPYRLAGASRVVRPDDVADEAETVDVDRQAAELEQAVHGHAEAHVIAHASTAGRAALLARGRAEELVSEGD